jgi:hypothetical protein
MTHTWESWGTPAGLLQRLEGASQEKPTLHGAAQPPPLVPPLLLDVAPDPVPVVPPEVEAVEAPALPEVAVVAAVPLEQAIRTEETVRRAGLIMAGTSAGSK